MKTAEIEMLRIDKSLRRAKCRRKLRGALLEELNVGGDEHKIDSLVVEYLANAKAAGLDANRAPGNRDLTYSFLEIALALFLLGSEPRRRASELARRLYSGHLVSEHKGSTLLTIILKALGPYSHKNRRTVHRDGTVLEYLVSRGVLPAAVPSYLGTRGQGIDSTYRLAQEFFNAHKSQRQRKYQLTITPRAAAKVTSQTANRNAIALIAWSGNGVVIKACLTDPARVREVIEFVNRKKPKN